MKIGEKTGVGGSGIRAGTPAVVRISVPPLDGEIVRRVVLHVPHGPNGLSNGF